MKRTAGWLAFLVCLVFSVLLFCQGPLDFSYESSAKNPEPGEQKTAGGTKEDLQEMRGCWFSYLEWQRILQNKNKEQFEKSVRAVFENLKACKINALMLHLRAFGDAFYPSSLSPISKYFAGNLCEQVEYDPLKIIIEIAKEYNISVHGWINPLRTMSDDDFSKISDKYILKKWKLAQNSSDYYMKDLTGRYILIPTNPEVRGFISDVIGEILSRYDLCGIHIDDYFYPSRINELKENDVSYYNKVKPGCDINTWRRQGTSELVKQMYKKCHEIKPDAKFGVSPQANMKNNFNSMFIDTKLWLSEPGYLDYIMPQIYFGFENSSSPFDKTFDEWNNLIKNDAELYVGLAAYKVGMEHDQYAGLGAKEWKEKTDILKRQEEYCRKCEKYRGYCLFSYQSIFQADGNVNPKTKQEIENLNSLS